MERTTLTAVEVEAFAEKADELYASLKAVGGDDKALRDHLHEITKHCAAVHEELERREASRA